MRTKRVLRYYCDHCSRGSLRRDSMERHEEGCVKNPIRKCSCCGMLQTDIKETALRIFEESDSNRDLLQRMRDVTEGCPVCMLALIAQGEYNQGPRDDDGDHFHFDYKQERKDYDDYKPERKDCDSYEREPLF